MGNANSKSKKSKLDRQSSIDDLNSTNPSSQAPSSNSHSHHSTLTTTISNSNSNSNSNNNSNNNNNNNNNKSNSASPSDSASNQLVTPTTADSSTTAKPNGISHSIPPVDPATPSKPISKSSQSTLTPVASSSSLSQLASTSLPSSSLAPDIPTTTTILANPMLNPSSLLSSTNPTSNSSTNLTAQTSSSTLIPAVATAPTVTGFLSTSPATPSKPQTFDIDDMITRLLDTGYSGKVTKSVCLKNAEITAVCQAAREVFLSQPTLIELSPPVKIVGDVHGQYSDLIRLFEMCGFPPSANYLFLGDYVDRGKQSLETILLLLCYKIKYPENFFLLRGNHECANVTRVYGFYDECKRRCNIKIWKTFVDVFNCLPIAAVVAQKIFAVHGGLSPSLTSMDDIRRISRPTDVPDYGLLNDLLWSDPSDTALDWEDNERGVSYCFGKTVIGQFLARYDFDLICRAHMVVEDGYEFWNDRTLVTIFSAPNYCGEFDNFAAAMSVSEDLLCAFELLKPLDSAQLKKELARSRRRKSQQEPVAV